MTNLNLPEYKFRITKREGKEYIFDIIRKKFVSLTPEEWVRQNFLRYMIEELHFPVSLVSMESHMKWNQMQKRTDILFHGAAGRPVLLVECKAPKVKITQDTFDQAAVYNLKLKVEYLVVTNGLSHYCCQIDHENKKFCFLKSIPEYTEIKEKI